MSGRAATLWSTTGPDSSAFSRPLGGDQTVDVAIVGGGYTGLWTAFSLLQSDPSMRVIVVERHHVGFGASGRNGGWCSALLPVSLTRLAGRHGSTATIAWQRAMVDTVDRVGEFAARSAAAGLDTDFHKAARSPWRATRRNTTGSRRRWPKRATSGSARTTSVSSIDARRTRRSAPPVPKPPCSRRTARQSPLRLVYAIAAAATRAGAHIVEGADVVEVEPRRLTTTAGTIRADVVVLATEAYTSQIRERHRDVLPIYSMMIGSEPLDETQWQDIGLADRPTFTVASHVVVYGQRTADDRLAFGGRGAPYHFGSRVADDFDTDERVRSSLRETVVGMFPVLGAVDFPHHWGGPLAAPRDWHPHVAYDRRLGLASAGGYVGDGVATANLAGRTLADLIVGRDTDVTRLPWVGHRSRRWEPEPLRWLGVNLVAAAAARADRAEASTRPLAGLRGRAWARVVETLAGR
jgi:glycine/D-amino acid oxidase-like deaminating enzyme